MLSRFNKLSTLPYLWLLFGIIVSLSGCVSTNLNGSATDDTAVHAFGPLTHDSRWYLARIDQSPVEQRFDLQVLATRSLINEGDSAQAQAVQQQLSKEVYTPRQQVALRLLKALTLGHKDRYQAALDQIANIDLRPLDPITVQFYYRLQADLEIKQNQLTAAANSLISMSPYVQGKQADQNNQEIWSLLQKGNLNLLKGYRNAAMRTNSDLALGWFELAILNQSPNKTSQLPAWQAKYPDHPGAQFVGLNKAKTTTPATTTPAVTGVIAQTTTVQQVAVFLPLSGQLASAGNALKTGIDMANNDSQPHVTLHYYDENSMAIADLLRQAKQDGAQMIIGPLQKNKLQDLVLQTPDIPVLALNQLDNQPASANMYYFALTPEAEAAQIAAKMHDNGIHHPLLILPSNALGERTAQGFNQYWNSLNQGPADIARFKTKAELMNLLMQKVGGSATNTASNLQSGQVVPLGSQPTTTSASSDKADGIFMVASAFEAATIKRSVDEMLGQSSVHPSYYLGSKTNAPGMRPDVALGLNQMLLGDMPWMLDKMPDQYAKAAAALPNAKADQLRLYAMGYDAAKLIPQLSDLRQNPEKSMSGLTGALHLTTDGVLLRDLTWIRFSDGQMLNP